MFLTIARHSCLTLLLLTALHCVSQSIQEKEIEAKRKIALGLTTKGYLFMVNYKKDSAIYYYSQGAEIYREIKFYDKYFDCRNRIARTYLLFGDFDSTISISNVVISESNSLIGSPNLAQSNAYTNIGIVCYEHKQYNKALSSTLKSLEIKDRIGEGETTDKLGNYDLLGLIYKDLGALDLALEYSEKSLNFMISTFGKTHHNVAIGLNNRGLIFSEKRDWINAKTFLSRGLEVREKLYGLESLPVAESLVNLGFVLSELGRYDSSLLYYRRSESLFTNLLGETHPHTLEAVRGKSRAFNKMGQLDSAIFYIGFALKSTTQGSDISIKLLEEQGRYYLKTADLQNSLHSLTKSINANFMGNGSTEIANVWDFGDPVSLLNSLNLRASVFHALYKKTEEKIYLDSALSELILVEKVNSQLKNWNLTRQDKIKVEKDQLESSNLAIEICLALYSTTQEEKYIRHSYLFCQKSKANLIQKSLMQIDAKRLGLLPKEIASLDSDLKDQKSYYSYELMKATTSEIRDSVQISMIKENLFEVNRRYDSLQMSIDSHFPAYKKIRHADISISLATLQNSLQTGEVFIEFFEGELNIYAFAITESHVSVFTIDNPTHLESIVKKMLACTNNFDQKESDENFKKFVETSSQLYNSILKPVIDSLSAFDPISKLIIVPDGQFSQFPFEILLTNQEYGSVGDYSGLSYLLKTHIVSYQYSSALFLYENNQQYWKTPTYVGYAPKYKETDTLTLTSLRSGASFANLRWNETEVQRSSKLFDGTHKVGSDAIKSTFLMDIGNHDIVHLASHSLTNHPESMYSALIFSGDSSTDRSLFTFELLNLEVSPELVVLSACNTGYGTFERGEGRLSLGSAISYAGASSVLMSYWFVDDQSTSQIVTSFYENLKRGKTKSEALRDAKLDFLKNNGNPLSFPPYWANLVLVGNDRPISGIGYIVYLTLGSIFLLAIGITVAIKMKMK